MLADNMSQFAWTCDLLGNVTWYNKRWLDYTGLTFEDMKGGAGRSSSTPITSIASSNNSSGRVTPASLGRIRFRC